MDDGIGVSAKTNSSSSLALGLWGEGQLGGSYGQSWCTRSGSGFFPGILNGLAVAKLDALDQVPEAIGAVELAPVTLGRLGELETRKGQETFAPISEGDRASRPWRGQRGVA